MRLSEKPKLTGGEVGKEIDPVIAEKYPLLEKIGIVKNSDKFEKLLAEPGIKPMLSEVKQENLEPVLEICKIETLKEFKEFCKNSRERREILSELTEEEREKIKTRDFSEFSFRKKLEPLIEVSPYYQKISSEFLKKLKKARGDYVARTFPEDLLRYISSSLSFSYLALEEPNKKTSKKIEELKEKDSNFYTKLERKISQKDFHLSDVIFGWRTAETFDKNIEYLLAAKRLEIPFDEFGVIGYNLEGLKEEVENRAEEIIWDFPKNKEKYLPYLDTLLGYGSEFPEWTNEILRIDNLWEFKTSHLEPELKSILNKIKDLKLKTKIGSVEFLKEPAEYLGAMNQEGCCMNPGREMPDGALTITQGPLFIIALKDELGKIKARSVLIPVKDKGKWKFELNIIYPISSPIKKAKQKIGDFIKNIEKILKKIDYYQGVDKIIVTEGREFIKGELPPTKTTSSGGFREESESERLYRFWRDRPWERARLRKE